MSKVCIDLYLVLFLITNFWQYLITTFEPSLVRLRVPLHLLDEDAAASLQPAQDLEVQDLVPRRSRQRHRPWSRLAGTR